MAQAETLRVVGYRELLRAFQQADRESRLELRHALRDVGVIVQREAIRLFSPIDARSAAGFKVRVRQRGVAVEQSRRKTTGQRPDYGSLQMRRALLPALASKREESEQEFEKALDKVADHFNRGGPVV